MIDWPIEDDSRYVHEAINEMFPGLTVVDLDTDQLSRALRRAQEIKHDRASGSISV